MRGNRLRASVRHPLVQAVLSLGTVQFGLIVMPLITLPYLARVLDRSELGIVVFVQTFSFLVSLVVEYGFNLSAPRVVATHRDEPSELGRTVAGVYGAKLLLSAAAVLLSLPLVLVVPIFRHSPDLLAYGVVLGLTQGFFPVWFYLGIERPQLAAIVDLSTRIAGLVAIVLLVRGGHDGKIVLAIYAVSGVASTGVLTVAVLRRVRGVTLAMETTREALRAGRTLFAGTGAIAFYTGANAFLLGLLVPAGQVATFAAAEKTVRAGNRVLGLMSSAVYPRVSSLLDAGRVQRANRLLSLSLLTFGGAALASAVVVAAAAPVIVDVIFGSRFHDAVPLLRILSLLLPLNVIGVTLSTQWLLPRGRDRAVAAVLLVACVLNAALVVLTARTLGLTATAWAVVLVELVVMLGYLRVVRRGEGRSGPSSVRPVARGGSTG